MATKTPRQKESSSNINVRLPDSLIASVDSVVLVEGMPLEQFTRTDRLRYLIALGLEDHARSVLVAKGLKAQSKSRGRR